MAAMTEALLPTWLVPRFPPPSAKVSTVRTQNFGTWTSQTTSSYVWGHDRYTSLYTWHAKVHKLQVKWLLKILCVVSSILSASCLIIAYQYSSKHTLFI